MSTHVNLISELESVLATNNLAKRAEMLRRVADLFVHGSGKYTDDQLDLFDDVMAKLIDHVELTARAAFGSRLAKLADAPPKTIRSLAFDDAVEVAAPVLEFSPRLDENALTENARIKSQGHLLAIAGRNILTEPVTDVLVARGNDAVAVRTANNAGAKFSDAGISRLAARASGNGALAMCIWARPDIPRHELLKLFVNATEMVRQKLESADPRRAALIRAAVAEASEDVQALARTGSHEHADAMAQVRSLHLSGKLDEPRLLVFARSRSFDRTAIALSLMCDLPLGPIERALVQSEPEQLLILAKAIDLSWETTKAILTLHPGPDGIAKDRLDRWFASYFRLQPKSAKAALQFYRLQEKAHSGAVLGRGIKT